ncbi:trans-sialidase, putative, partial [Trypanosoma cruzi marinkellei]
MFRRVFYSAVLLLLVAIMCCGIGAASTGEVLSGVASSPGKYYVWREKNEGETVGSLRVPSLVEMNGDVFAVAQAPCTKNGGKDGLTGIASELLSLTGEQDTKEELDKSKLKTQVLEECPSGGENCASQNAARAGFQGVREVLVARPTTVVNGTDIYMLAGIYSRGVTAGTGESGKYELGILLAGGNVSDDKGGSGKRIYWNGIDALQSSL